jgi:hypothetical protein
MLKITTTQDCLPTNFRDVVRMLTRPYTPISETQARRLDLLVGSIPSVIHFMEPNEYMSWLAGRPDTETERANWAATLKN